MQSRRELRSFTVSMVFHICLWALFTIEGSIAALYFGARWSSVYLGLFGFTTMFVFFAAGWFAVRKAEQQRDPAEFPNLSPKAERWGVISAVFGLLLAILCLYNGIGHLGQAQLTVGFKITLSLLVPVFCTAALLQFREARFKFHLARRQEKQRQPYRNQG